MAFEALIILCDILTEFFSHQFSSQRKRGDIPPWNCIFHVSQIFTQKQRWYIGVKMKSCKIESVFFSLSAPFYEVTLFLYLLRPWRTGGKNQTPRKKRSAFIFLINYYFSDPVRQFHRRPVWAEITPARPAVAVAGAAAKAVAAAPRQYNITQCSCRLRLIRMSQGPQV